MKLVLSGIPGVVESDCWYGNASVMQCNSMQLSARGTNLIKHDHSFQCSSFCKINH